MRWHDSERLHEALVEFFHGDGAAGHCVEHPERIKEVEINMMRQVDLGLLDQSLLVDQLHQHVQEFILELISSIWR